MSTVVAWQEVRAIFETAQELAAGERDAYLSSACSGDEGLRSQVEELLQAAGECGDFLESPALNAVLGPEVRGHMPQLPGASLPHRVGPYEVQQRIGHGGVGAVYLVRGPDDSRDLALKLIRRGMDSDDVISRFHQEREILAGLEHPNIARLLDAGSTADGLPYLVMEYIDGEPILDSCQRRGLSTEDRLRLFQQACEAVSYAHRHLVVHRDITPSNILVTGGGALKLLDFGLAKVLTPRLVGETADRTATLLRMLTPAYASPEQVRGEPITTASDIYSLGVVLYEMLTGERPYRFSRRTPEEIVRVVCEEPPARSSAFNALPRDLQTIILMALRKEPLRRYATVDALAEDLRRYRSGLPVSARKDTFAYRAGKLIRRNRAAVAATVVIFLALSAGVASTIWQARVAEAERELAERRYRDLRRLAGSLLFEFDDAIMDLAGSTAARELLVTRALEYLSALEAESIADLSLQRDLAVAYSRVGEVQSRAFGLELGDLSGALMSFHKAMVIRQALVDADPSNLGDQNDLAESLLRIAQVMGSMCNPTDDVQYARQAVTIRTVLLDADPENLGFKSGLAAAYETLGMALMREGDHQGMLDAFSHLRALREELLAVAPSSSRSRCDLAEAFFDMGVAQYLGGRLDGALASLEEARAINASLVEASPGSERYRRELMRAHTQIGVILIELDGRNEGLEHLRQAVAIGERLQATDPANAKVRHRLAEAYRELGSAFAAAGARSDATTALAKARDLLESWWRSNPANAEIAVTLAGVYEALGLASEPQVDVELDLSLEQWSRAARWYQRSLDLWHDLAMRDRLVPLYGSRPQRVAEAVVRCEEAIAARHAGQGMPRSL